MTKLTDLSVLFTANGCCFRRRDQGGWVNSTMLPGVRFKVRGLRSREMALAQARHPTPWADAYSNDRRPWRKRWEDEYRRRGECLEEAIFLGVSGLDIEPLNRYGVAKLLSDPAYRLLQEAVLEAAHEIVTHGIDCDLADPCVTCHQIERKRGHETDRHQASL